MRVAIIISSIILFVLGGFLTFISFVMAMGEPGHDVQLKMSFYLMCGALASFILCLLWPQRKK